MIMWYLCRPHSSDYGMRGRGNMRVLGEIEPPTPDTVPHHLPGQNPYLAEVAGGYGLPTMPRKRPAAGRIKRVRQFKSTAKLRSLCIGTMSSARL